jgi:gas vesicle protein
MSNGKIILGVLAGAAVGALLGILFAPDKGKETRKKIIHKGEEYVDNLKEKVNSLLRDGTKKPETVTESAV